MYKGMDLLGKPIQFHTDDTKLVLQYEYGVTRASSPHPILATEDIGPCAGLALYHHDQSMAFLTHIHDIVNLDVIIMSLGFHTGNVTAQIVSEQNLSNSFISSITDLLQKMNIKTIKATNGGTLAIDARTGQMFIADSQLFELPHDKIERTNRIEHNFVNNLPMPCCYDGRETIS